MADTPVSGERFIPEPPEPDDHADAATLAKAPVSGVWFIPHPSGRGCGVVDPAIASEADISFDPPDVPHPVRDELGIPLNRYLFFVVLTAPLGWDGYTYELVGIDPPPGTSGTMPTFRFPNMVMPGIPFLVAYQRRITHREKPVYLEACWHPETGDTNRLVSPPHVSLKTAQKHGTTMLKLLQKVENRGRPPGPDGFKDTQEFENTLVDLIQTAHRKGLGTKQERIAVLLQPVLAQRRRDTDSPASVDIDTDSTKRLIRQHIQCPWRTLVKKALQST